jgi:hypothetical protein
MIIAAIALAAVLGAGVHPGSPAEMRAGAAHGTGTKFSWVGSYYVARAAGASAVLPQAHPKLDPLRASAIRSLR